MSRTGVEIAVQDSASAPAKNIARGFDEITKSADGINSALDPKILDEYNQKLTQIGERYSQLQNKEKNYQQQQITTARQFQGAVSGVGTGISQLGAGDIGGAGISAGKGLTGMLSGLGGAGVLLGGLGLTAGVIGNTLADQYQQRATPAQRLAGLSGDFTTDMRKNTDALNEAMASTVESVAKYGKTYEEGIRAQEAFLIAGGSDFGAGRAGAYSMAGRGDMANLASFAGLTQRYGQSGALDAIEGLRRTQGLGVGQFEELMGGVQEVFTSGLSRGMVRNVTDITKGLGFFGQAGATFQGGLGAQRMMQMNQGVAGAAALQSQEDFIAFRAAQSVNIAGGGGGGLWETRKELERGMTPEFFKSLISEYDRLGYGREESLMALQKRTGLSAVGTEELYALRDKEITEADVTGVLEGTGKTGLTQYIGDVEKLKQSVSKIGAKAFDQRAKLLGGVEVLIEATYNMPSEINAGLTVIAEDFKEAIGLTDSSPQERASNKRIAQIATKLDIVKRRGATPEQLAGFYSQYEDASFGDWVNESEATGLMNTLHNLILSMDRNSDSTDKNTGSTTEIEVEARDVTDPESDWWNK